MATSTDATTGVVPERWALGEGFVPKGRYVDRDFAKEVRKLTGDQAGE